MLALAEARRPAARRLGKILIAAGLLVGGYLAFALSVSVAGSAQATVEPEIATTSMPPEDEQEQAASDQALVPIVDVAPPSAEDAVEAPAATAAPPTQVVTRGVPFSYAPPRQSATVPILMYHHVNDLPRSETDPYLRDLTVGSLAFRQQLDLLEVSGVKTISLADLMSYLHGGDTPPERAVVLTFDDGYEDNYRLAFPLLKQYGMNGTFFVVAGLVGKPGYMTWEQLREMQLGGMAVESHSLDHIDLAVLPYAALERQLTESRRIIELNLMRPVRYLNYPSGRYTPAVIAATRAAGYEAAVTVNYGLVQRAAAPYELRRVRVKGADTVESLAAKMIPAQWAYSHGPFGQ